MPSAPCAHYSKLFTKNAATAMCRSAPSCPESVVLVLGQTLPDVTAHRATPEAAGLRPELSAKAFFKTARSRRELTSNPRLSSGDPHQRERNHKMRVPNPFERLNCSSKIGSAELTSLSVAQQSSS